jgi:hypothetical protein
LLDLLDEHVAICSETVYCQDCAIGAVETRERLRIDIEEEVGGRSGTYSLKTFGAYLVLMLKPSLCRVSPAMTEKSWPAIARMVPPFSVYGLKDRVWGMREPSGIGGLVEKRD